MALASPGVGNYVALIINIMDRNMWTVVQVKGNKKVDYLPLSFSSEIDM